MKDERSKVPEESIGPVRGGSDGIDPVGAESGGSDTEGHSLLQAELHRTIAASRAKEVADWGRSERARHETQEARKRRSK